MSIAEEEEEEYLFANGWEHHFDGGWTHMRWALVVRFRSSAVHYTKQMLVEDWLNQDEIPL